jgi:Tol biopolymer transport system component
MSWSCVQCVPAGRGLGRRGFLSLLLAAAAQPWSLALAGEPAPDEQQEWGDTPVTLTQGTNVAIALSPDGRTLAMDLQGVLWTLPVAGGTARRLTGYLHDMARPAWSPDGRTIVFQSYRDGQFHLWSIGSDGQGLRQLTHGLFDCREPAWSPDGREIAFACDRSGRYALYALDVATGDVRVLADTGGEDGEPAWSPDGRRLAFSSSGRIAVLELASPGAAPQPVHSGPRASAPAWSRDGRLSWTVLDGSPRDLRSSRLWVDGRPVSDEAEDVFPVPAVWCDAGTLLYAADGVIRRRSLAAGVQGEVPFEAVVRVTARRPPLRSPRAVEDPRWQPVRGLSMPVLAPGGDRVAFTALGQLWLLSIGEPMPRQLTHDASAKLGPAWSPDGRHLVYASDRGGGLLQLWRLDLESGSARQLTHLDVPLKQAAWSPDGTRIACATEDGWLALVDAETGSARRIARQTPWSGRPSWSPDGRHLMLAALQPASGRFREGVNAVLVVHVASGRMRYQSPQPGVSLDLRNVNGPLWSPDGRWCCYTQGGRPWRIALDADGTLQGAPEPMADEPTDALSLDASGRWMLALRHGELRLHDLASAGVRSVPCGLRWRHHRPAAPRLVVHAGRCWDGRADTLREDVDLVIEGQRIVAVEPHRRRRGVRWIDASRLTVMPGLVDLHTHREMGNQLGAREPRLQLAYGITATRGLADNAYLALENRESVDAGWRVGPRHFGTGEACEGSRLAYDGMHPVRTEEEMRREADRAAALDYDLMKCYVRLSPERQLQATRAAQRLGIGITSHYLFPAVAFGAAGHEHMGGTSRFGYSRTGSLLGTGYQDVVAIAAAARSYRVPTLFGLEGLLGDTPDDVLRDPRVQRLFTQAMREPLERAARAGASRPVPMVARQVATIRAQQAAGVLIACGSDFPIVPPGLGLHLNLRGLVRYGMPPVEALRTATLNAGRVLGQPLGSLAPGQWADLVAVQGDPLTDIRAAMAVQWTMVGGVAHTMSQLIAPFTEAPPPAAALPPSAWAGRRAGEGEPWWHDPHWVAWLREGCCTGLG